LNIETYQNPVAILAQEIRAAQSIALLSERERERKNEKNKERERERESEREKERDIERDKN
jgi:hypothetical protein